MNVDKGLAPVMEPTPKPLSVHKCYAKGIA